MALLSAAVRALSALLLALHGVMVSSSSCLAALLDSHAALTLAPDCLSACLGHHQPHSPLLQVPTPSAPPTHPPNPLQPQDFHFLSGRALALAGRWVRGMPELHLPASVATKHS